MYWFYLTGSRCWLRIQRSSGEFRANFLILYHWLSYLTLRGLFLFCCSIHICVTYLQTKEGVADLFVKDVRECCAKLLKEPHSQTEGMVSLQFLFFVLMSFNNTSWENLLHQISGFCGGLYFLITCTFAHVQMLWMKSRCRVIFVFSGFLITRNQKRWSSN